MAIETHQTEYSHNDSYRVQLPLFEGPLDLLLHLIEQRELDITRVALAEVTDQYLEYLAVLKDVDAESLTDFLVVAAKLILIKSRALLPKPPPSLVEEEDEDVGDQLARQLRAYKQFKTVADILRGRESNNLKSFVRVAAPPKIEPRLSVGDLTAQHLLLAVRQALAIRPADPDVDEVVAPITVSIGQQIKHIRDQLVIGRQLSFMGMLQQARSRVEVLVTFMAVLELVKLSVIDVEQDTLFGDIVILPKSNEHQDWER